MRIGIDFDNTIIGYDNVFLEAARERGLISGDFHATKQGVRDSIRRLPDGELAWQRLQGHVYGKGILEARMFDGVVGFLRRCRAAGNMVAIISHKTEFGHYDPDLVNLRTAALDWMTTQGLIDDIFAVPRKSIYFESTRAAKLDRIASLSLTHFIDDLEEVLTDPGFPPHIERILFAACERPRPGPYIVCSTWREIERRLFEGLGH